MNDINITIPGGASKRLKTAGKYCETDIVVTAEGGDTEAAFEAGKQAEYDVFWDAFQQNGERTSYIGAFRSCWTDEIFKPKYDMHIDSSGAQQLFQDSSIRDLKGCLEKAGVVLDTSACTSFLQMFQSSDVRYVPVIDMRNAHSNTNYVFSSPDHISIDKILVSDVTVFGTQMFNARNLVSVIFEGTVANNGLRLDSCTKLSHESLMSVINCLKDFSGTGETRTVTLGADNLAKLSDSEKAIATQKGWSLV